MSQVRTNNFYAASLLAGYSSVRVSLTFSESLLAGYPNVRTSQLYSEPLVDGFSAVRVSQFYVESLIPAPPEYVVVTAILPGFGNSTADPSIPEAANPSTGATPGLTFSVHKKPMFNTRVSEAVNFNTVRSRLAPHPRWQFELPYEFLEDSSGAESSLKQLMGFFCARGGKADPFLVKDPDDYLVTRQSLGTSDGRVQWDFLRWIGSEFSEPVGQVDTANTITLYGGVDESSAVPSTGLHQITVTHAATFGYDQGVKISGVALTPVTGAPGPMQYAVSAGVYTFNAAQNGATAVISYAYVLDPATYTITLPNKVVFSSVPATGTRLYWTGQFFFTCYFEDDVADFEKFAKQLWELQVLTFHSELLA